MIENYIPQPPAEDEWGFVQELSQPYKRHFYWDMNCSAASDEADLRVGVNILPRFPDPVGRLETAYADLRDFFVEGNINLDGAYQITTEKVETSCHEAYKLVIDGKCCRIQAGDTEGIRRGIFQLEDLLLSARGPLLKTGTIERKPWLKSRISRCFFGPIKRPPFNRDELMDDVDYYPEAYLNRLAHEGINGLWLTIVFSDLCKTSITELDPNAERRLAKLRRTVEKCLRYGIKTYIFCIEPRSLFADSDLMRKHPELKGAPAWNKQHCFCTFSETAQQYLYESVNWLFTQVPGLGGLINISFGERPTNCLSADYGRNCPVCSHKSPGEIIVSSLRPMERGMHDVAPDAELISWLYVPQNGTGPRCDAEMLDVAAKLPENVILQYNFESSGGKEQVGKYRHAGDYWLSYEGPSELFADIARTASGNRNQVSAKIQVGCSHEVATVPFVPVPALLYRKYRAMREIGVSHVMQCWYFGNYPGIMNKAAGALAFNDFSDTEEDFLLRLARPEWGEYSGEVVRAWKLLADGYANYPLENMFQYYGPMHDGLVWPLYLQPADKPLAPTWRLDYGTSGDRYGECLGSFTLEDVLTLTREMSRLCGEGADILCGLRPAFDDDWERLKDIGLAEALALQFASGHDIMQFYALREALPGGDVSVLDRMAAIVRQEIKRSERMLELCEQDSRLGFHSEAEGYKYFPAKLRWRIELLQELLREEFPAVRTRIEQGLKPFNEQAAKSYVCNSGHFEPAGDFTWRADYQNGKLEICVDNSENSGSDEAYTVFVEEKPFHPPRTFTFKGRNKAEISLPEAKESIGFNILKIGVVDPNNPASEYVGWVPFEPLTIRLGLGIYNPAAKGKLILH